MTDEQLNIICAEADGFKQYGPEGNFLWYRDGDEDLYTNPPDYGNDLNAMHRLVTGMNWLFLGSQRFILELRRVCGRDRGVDASLKLATSELIHATAAQRREAFVRTIGKWEDNS